MKNDWRINLFGDSIRINADPDDTVDSFDSSTSSTTEPLYISTEDAFDPKKYDYIAAFIGASYCSSCVEFAPLLCQSVLVLEQEKRCKAIFVSNDRDEKDFESSCQKTFGMDVMPYNLQRTQQMRTLFGLETIPALMILRNDNWTAAAPTVIVNARHWLAKDPSATQFPWNTTGTNGIPRNDKPGSVSGWDRFLVQGHHGHWWEYGHRVNPEKPEEQYMDEHAVRIRAGILNSLSWIALMNVHYWQEPRLLYVLFTVVAFEFISSMTVGMTPIAPIGTVATGLAMLLTPEPLWKPARPKRFAWGIGLTLATLCFVFWRFRKELGSNYIYLNTATILACNMASWLEASAGFCVGCFIYNKFGVPWFDLEECQECKFSLEPTSKNTSIMAKSISNESMPLATDAPEHTDEEVDLWV